MTSESQQASASTPDYGIGITMSGGGYRAAAYHLGTLSYVERLRLLPKVEAISTVSGGTFTGTRYLLSLAQQESFQEFLGSYYGFLLTTDLLDLAVHKLGAERHFNNLPRQLAIDAFAQVYADTLLKKKDGSTFLMKDVFEVQSPLTDVVFNSTEFRHGIGYRFQRTQRDSKFGNKFEFLLKEDAAKLRVADILAASSCFPGGFEPLAWPKSFHTDRPAVSDDRQLPMMDGGVYDNQGIESLLLADRRSRDNPGESSLSTAELQQSAERFQMLIISDTDRLDDLIYSFPAPPPSSLIGSLSLGTLGWLFWLVILLCIITAGADVWDLYYLVTFPKHRTWLGGISRLTSLALALAVVFIGLSSWNFFYRKLAPRIPHWKRIRGDLRHLILSQAVEMIQLRISSLFALANDIFMKRIRSLLYSQIYSNDSLKKTAVSSMIYKLRKFAPVQSRAETERFGDTHSPGWPFPNHPQIPQPSELLLEIVDDSVKMPTTLWFDDKSMLPKLIATGQATLCFQLLSHINFRSPGDKELPEDVKQLWDVLVADWKVFQTDPYAVLRSQLPTELHSSLHSR